MNPIITNLYNFNKDSTNPKDYYKFKSLMIDTISWRVYSLSWKVKYFVRLLIWKMLGV